MPIISIGPHEYKKHGFGVSTSGAKFEFPTVLGLSINPRAKEYPEARTTHRAVYDLGFGKTGRSRSSLSATEKEPAAKRGTLLVKMPYKYKKPITYAQMKRGVSYKGRGYYAKGTAPKSAKARRRSTNKRKRKGRRAGKLMHHRDSFGRVGRDWPPTKMLATFENHFEYDPVFKANNLLDFEQFLQLGTAVDGGGIGRFVSADAAGTRETFTSKPRNWDILVPHYKRGRVISTSFVVEWEYTASNQGLYICSWISSDLDDTNPLQDLFSNMGNSAPFNASKGFRDILLQSRRVQKRKIMGTGSTGPGKMLTQRFTVKQDVDRLGNRVDGGRKARTSAGSTTGSLHAMDFNVADLLILNQGMDNKVNIAIFPIDDTVTPVFSNCRIRMYSKVYLYDRVINAGT